VTDRRYLERPGRCGEFHPIDAAVVKQVAEGFIRKTQVLSGGKVFPVGGFV